MAITLNGTTGISNDGGYTGDGVSFADTTPANTLVTTTGGNVGIGTSSPTTISGYTTLEVNNNTTGAIIDLAQADTMRGRLVATTSSFVLETSGSIPIIFSTGGSEDARIDSSGNLLVGTTSNTEGARLFLSYPTSASGGSAVIGTEVNGTQTLRAIAFRNPNGLVGTITTSGSATAYNTSSDYRLKENIAPMTGALATVSSLKPVTYNWKVDGSDGQGFIAHELQAVVPDCVTGEKDAVETYVDEDGVEQTRPVYQGIDTSFLVATLTAAIQEQTAIITDLKSRIEALEQA